MQIQVYKFGGTSVGSAERFRAAAALCAEGAETGPLVVVSSAMSKVTDTLVAVAQHASEGQREEAAVHLAALRRRHHETAQELVGPENRD